MTSHYPYCIGKGLNPKYIPGYQVDYLEAPAVEELLRKENKKLVDLIAEVKRLREDLSAIYDAQNG